MRPRCFLFVIFAALALFALLPTIASADSSFASLGSGAGQIASSGPSPAVSRQSGDVYVLDPGNQRIDQFSSTGTFLRAFGWGVVNGAAQLQTCTVTCRQGLAGAGAGQLSSPEALAVDNDPLSPSYGDLYVTNKNNLRIEKYGPAGEFLLAFGWGVANGTSELQTCGPQASPPTVTCQAGIAGTGTGQFNPEFSGTATWPLAIGSDGTIYVGERNHIFEFAPDGSYLGEVTMPAAGEATQLAASALAVDDSCDLQSPPLTALTNPTCEQFDPSFGDIYVRIAPNDERQLLTPPAAGTYTLEFEGQRTKALAHNATEPEVQDALEELSTLGPAVAVVFPASEGALPVIFDNRLANTNVPQLIASAGSVTTVAQGFSGEFVELKPDGTPVRTFPQSVNPQRLALTENGYLIVGDQASADEYRFEEYTPTGQPFAIFTSGQIHGAQNPNSPNHGRVSDIAVGDAAGRLYVTNVEEAGFTGGATIGVHVAAVDLPEPGPPEISTKPATEVEPATAVLNGLANAGGYDAEVHFEYLSAQRYAEDGNTFGAGTEETHPKADIGLLIHDQSVSGLASGLHPETAYRFRAVIESECEPQAHPGEKSCKALGAVEEFTTRAPVTVENLTTQTVGPEFLELKADVNPNGQATEYTFQYGLDTNYAAGSVSGTLGVSTDPSTVTASFTGLQPNTTYHYRLTAHNSFGSITTSDREFTTETKPGEGESCPNAQLRAENSSIALPDCRAYEQVSPVEKAGYSVKSGPGITGPLDLASTGERVLFASNGAFAGAGQSHSVIEYVAHRTEAGWLTQPAMMPVTPTLQTLGPIDFTAGLDSWLVPAEAGSNFEGTVHDGGPTAALFLGAADGSFRQATPTLASVNKGQYLTVSSIDFHIVGSSSDLGQIDIVTSFPLLESDPLRTGQLAHLYQVDGAGGPSPTLTLLADAPADLNQAGAGGCGIDENIANWLNLVSADGSVVFYGSPLDLQPGKRCASDSEPKNANKEALYAHFDAAPPLQIAPPPSPYPTQCHSPAPCFSAPPASATFYGASPDASRIWFTTTQPLLDADTDETADLYYAQLENGSVKEIVQASGGGTGDPHPGAGAGLKGVVQVSADGNRAYFAATGLLTTKANGLGQTAAQGADNLYSYDAVSGAIGFVARLCSGPAESGSISDPACGSNLAAGETESVATSNPNDTGLWRPDSGKHQAQLTPDGRYLLFVTSAQLIGSGPEADTDAARDVYRFDAQTGQIVRISTGRNGNDGNGNDDAFNASIAVPQLHESPAQAQKLAEDDTRAITDDGSTVVFATAAPLASPDTNTGAEPACGEGLHSPTGCDVYEWHEGRISLVSDGLDPHGALANGEAFARISPSGRDIAFATDRSLAVADTDGTADAYDARINGGFPRPPLPEICEGNEPCHGPVSPEPGPPRISTPQFVGPGNERGQLECAKDRHRVKKHGEFRCVPNKHHKKKTHKKHKRARNLRRPST